MSSFSFSNAGLPGGQAQPFAGARPGNSAFRVDQGFSHPNAPTIAVAPNVSGPGHMSRSFASSSMPLSSSGRAGNGLHYDADGPSRTGSIPPGFNVIPQQFSNSMPTSGMQTAPATEVPVRSLARDVADGKASQPRLTPVSELYGMNGLASALRTADKDLPAFALGIDMSTAGVHLSQPRASAHLMQGLLACPWQREPAYLESQWSVPSSYKLAQPALKTGHLAKFDSSTLLYIFYSMPRDVLQAYAAQELYARQWRYHRDLKTWFKQADVGSTANKSTSPAWSYFDTVAWQVKTYLGKPQGSVSFTSGFLTDDECRARSQ